jgi:hypothetical protein
MELKNGDTLYVAFTANPDDPTDRECLGAFVHLHMAKRAVEKHNPKLDVSAGHEWVASDVANEHLWMVVKDPELPFASYEFGFIEAVPL